MAHETAQPELLRRINTSTILSLIEANSMISRAELARRSGLSRATVSNIVENLLASGLVKEEGIGDSQGGRPPVLLAFNPSAWYTIGAELVDLEWMFVLVDLRGEIQKRAAIAITGHQPEDALNTLIRGYYHILDNFSGPILPGIGLGVPGLVDDKTGVIKSAADLGWVDIPFQELVEKELPVSVYIINRHKAAGLVEARYGEGISSSNLFYVGIGSGVAAAIFLEGNMLQGANSSAGELGHVTVEPNGRPCPCGNYGCLQQYVSGPAMATRARELIRSGNRSMLEEITDGNLQLISGKLVCDTATHGDSLALKVIREAAGYLGIALANIINIINPDTIVLGGPIGRNSGELFLGPLQEVLRKRTMSHPLAAVRIASSTMGGDAGARGAAALVLAEKVDLILAAEDALTL
ncbi:MAG: ROK family transcriptional regulator [Firmicutes bacterium]|nr:ROK family transcriptional regulator [Bacillota bacterium]